MTTTQPTCTVRGFFRSINGVRDPERVQHATLHFDGLPDYAAAVDVIGQFPKSCRLRAYPVNAGSFSVHIVLEPNGANGGVNETGVKRIRTILATCDRLGIAVEYVGTGYGNVYPTFDDFKVAAGI